MDMRQLEYFVAIAEEKSLSKAAQRVFVSQPTLSNFLSRLEKSENSALVERGQNSFSLTEAGQVYYESCKQILKIRSECERRFSLLRDSQGNRLCFGVHAERGVHLLMQVMNALSPRYPDMHIELKQAGAPELVNMVLSGDADLAFSAYNGKNPQLEYIDYPALEIAVVMDPSHPLAGLGATDPHGELPHLPLQEFDRESFCLLSRGSVLGDLCYDYCLRNDVSLNVAVYVHNIASAFDLVSNGQMLSLCPVGLLPSLRGEYSYVGLSPRLDYHTAVYYNRDVGKTRLMADFIRVLRQSAPDEYR